MSGAAELVRLRAALDRAEGDTPKPGPGATPAERQRAYASRCRASSARLSEARFDTLAATFLADARHYDEQAVRLEEEAGLC